MIKTALTHQTVSAGANSGTVNDYSQNKANEENVHCCHQDVVMEYQDPVKKNVPPEFLNKPCLPRKLYKEELSPPAAGNRWVLRWAIKNRVISTSI